MPIQSHILYGYSGQITRYVRLNERVIYERFIPSFITNVPRGEQRVHIMVHLYPWMCAFPDECNPLVRQGYSFLRIVWYLPEGLPHNALPGVQVHVPSLGLFTFTDEVVYDLTHFICWIRVRNVWIDALKGPVRYGAIGVPMTWSQLPEDQHPPRSWTSSLRTRLHHHFPSIIRPSIVPSPLHLKQEGSVMGPAIINAFSVDPYYAPMPVIGEECEAEVETVVVGLKAGEIPEGRYLFRED